MERSAEVNPDLLTYRLDDGRAGRGLGGVAALFGFAALGSGLVLYLDIPRPRAVFYSSLSLIVPGGLLLAWGLHHVLRRSGLTLDRKPRMLIRWVRFPWTGRIRLPLDGTSRESDLQSCDRVAVGRSWIHHGDGVESYEVFPIFIQDAEGSRFLIDPGTHDPDVSHRLATEIAEHLGLPVMDESGDAGMPVTDVPACAD